MRLGELIFLTHVFNQFKEMADSARANLKESVAAGKPRQKVYPTLELKNTPLVQALLPLDFSKPRQRILKEIVNSAALRFIPVEKLKEEGYGQFLPLFEGKK